MKLFGFRSNKLVKKIFSITYLVILSTIFIAVMSQGKFGSITARDFILYKISNLVVFFFFFSPYIFLSQTKFRDKLPLFKKHQVWANMICFIILFILTVCLNSAIKGLHTKEYLADMENHAYEEVSLIEATCEENGKLQRICEYCGRQESEILPATGHVMQVILDDENQTVKQCKSCEKQEIKNKNDSVNPQTQENNDKIKYETKIEWAELSSYCCAVEVNSYDGDILAEGIYRIYPDLVNGLDKGKIAIVWDVYVSTNLYNSVSELKESEYQGSVGGFSKDELSLELSANQYLYIKYNAVVNNNPTGIIVIEKK